MTPLFLVCSLVYEKEGYFTYSPEEGVTFLLLHPVTLFGVSDNEDCLSLTLAEHLFSYIRRDSQRMMIKSMGIRMRA